MATYNIPEHLRGDTFDGKIFTILRNGVALDLTNATVKMDLRKGGEKYLRLSTSPATGEGSLTITDAAGGKIRIDEQIIDVPGNTYSYEIEILWTSGRKKTYIAGSWVIREDVTYDR